MSEEREENFTPGPWRWLGSPEWQELKLATAHSGFMFIMGFKRWGMNSAQPTFKPFLCSTGDNGVPASKLLKFKVGDPSVTGYDEAKKDGSVYRYDIVGIDSPDAHLIAAAPCLYEAVKLACSKMEPGSDLHERLDAVMRKARGEAL